MTIIDKLKDWYNHATGRNRFEYKSVGEAFAEWQRRTKEVLIYARDSRNKKGKNPVLDSYLSQLLKEYREIARNTPPQDIRKLNRLIKNCGIEIIAEEAVSLAD